MPDISDKIHEESLEYRDIRREVREIQRKYREPMSHNKRIEMLQSFFIVIEKHFPEPKNGLSIEFVAEALEDYYLPIMKRYLNEPNPLHERFFTNIAEGLLST
ncbi:MAG: hypothetical protein SFH39_00060 [Candidatus Magnetobacterium sp. LHC-1]